MLRAFFALILLSGALATETEKQLREEVRLQPDSFQANHLLGEFLIQRKQLREAIAPLEKADSIAPTNYTNSYDLALVYLQTGLNAKSRQVVMRLLGQDDQAELHNLLAEVEAADHHFDEAARQYEVAARMDPSEKNLFDLGSYLTAHNGSGPAVTVFRFGTERYAKSGMLRVGLGVALYSLGQYDEAMESLCLAVDLNPSDDKALDFLGKMHNVSPKYAGEVTQRLAHFVRIYPANAAANYYYALSLRKRQAPAESAEAEKYLLRAIKLKPDFAEPHFELGMLYEDGSVYSKAIGQYELVTKLKPDFAKAHYHLARLYRQQGRKDLAEKEFRAFQALKVP